MLRNKKRSGGFTLIEILITLAITAIVGVGLATFLSPQLGVYNAMNDSSDAKSTCNTVFNMVQDEIRDGKGFAVSGDTLTYSIVTSAGGSDSASISSDSFNGSIAEQYRGRIKLTFGLAAAAQGQVEVTVAVMSADGASTLYTTTQTVLCRNAALSGG